MTPQELFEKYADYPNSKDGMGYKYLTQQQFTKALAEALCCGQVQPDVLKGQVEVGKGGLLPCKDEIMALHKAWKEWLSLYQHIPTSDMLESMGRLFECAGIGVE